MIKIQENKVSIIILTWNKLRCTKLCLNSLYKNTKYPNWELIIVDNNSSDGTQIYLNHFQKNHINCKTIFNSKNEGFARGNNQAITKAHGHYILFLNNDIFITPNWLNHLMICMLSKSNVGIVGAKLIYPQNKKIQHAGVVFSPSGKPFHIYRNQNPSKKCVNVQKTYNAVTAACMLVKRTLLDELKGFDENFKLGSYEDIDLCLRARLKNYLILFCPQCKVYHYEYSTSRQFKSFNRLAKKNFEIFMQKWSKLLKHFNDPALSFYLKFKYRVIEAIEKIIPSFFLQKLQTVFFYSKLSKYLITY
ncbi:MAG: glycosyltransferase family 2 protein [Promethearchaeota archaeon]